MDSKIKDDKYIGKILILNEQSDLKIVSSQSLPIK